MRRRPFDGWCPFQLKDLTGLDSIVSPMVSLVLLLLGQALPRIEHRWFNPVDPESIKAGAEASSAAASSTSSREHGGQAGTLSRTAAAPPLLSVHKPLR